MCEWFAGCIRVAAGFVHHAILGNIPCCKECAEKLGMTLESE